ncbi:MAG: hypothetical protein V1792_14370 [Pseudomonadota bacterium]
MKNKGRIIISALVVAAVFGLFMGNAFAWPYCRPCVPPPVYCGPPVVVCAPAPVIICAPAPPMLPCLPAPPPLLLPPLPIPVVTFGGCW